MGSPAGVFPGAMPRAAITTLALLLCLVAAGSASAATRYAKPGAPPKDSQCFDVNDPCPLTQALDKAQAGDTISLANGVYEDQANPLPALALHWVPTDRQSRPILTSGGAQPTVALAAGQSGSSFDGIEIDKTMDMVETNGVPAVQVAAGVDARITSTVIRGPVCVDAPDAGALTIERSSLSSSADSTCARLGARSTLRASVVRRVGVTLAMAPPASVVTDGTVEDTSIDGGLRLIGPDAVARRVRVSGCPAIAGQGLVVDSLARAVGGGDGAAIAVDTPQGGTLRVVNATAIADQVPALLANPVRSATGPVTPNLLQVSNTVARGGRGDVVAPALIACALGQFCAFGKVEIDHSNFAVRDPAAGATGAALIAEGPGNQAGDPRFVSADDFHLRAGSPAVDAGAVPGPALALDLDGHPRVQGAGPDLGAYETTPAGLGAGLAGVGSSSARPVDRVAPVLGALRLRHVRFHVGRGATALTTTTTEAGRLTIAVQRRSGGRWVTRRPALTRRVAKAGRVTIAFDGRIGRRALAPGRYRFAVTAIDAAGNRSRTKRIAFTVVAPAHG